MRPAVIILGPSALATGERAARAIDGELHGFGPRVPGCPVSFAGRNSSAGRRMPGSVSDT